MEEKKPAASPDPAEQVEELLAQARQTAAGRVSRREMDAILESVRSQGAPEPSGAKRVRQGKTAPDEQDLRSSACPNSAARLLGSFSGRCS